MWEKEECCSTIRRRDSGVHSDGGTLVGGGGEKASWGIMRHILLLVLTRMQIMEHHGEAQHEGSHKPKQVTLRFSKRTLTAIVIVLFLGALGYFGRGLFVAAVVDGTPISRVAVIRELESISGKQALDSLVAQRLIKAEALRKGITVTDKEVEEEIAKIGIQMSMQGSSLEAALAAQGMTEETLKKQLYVQKLLEKLVAGTIEVTDEEVAQYIKNNKIVVPPGQEEQQGAFIKDQLTQQKSNAAKTEFVNELRAKAKIVTVVEY